MAFPPFQLVGDLSVRQYARAGTCPEQALLLAMLANSLLAHGVCLRPKSGLIFRCHQETVTLSQNSAKFKVLLAECSRYQAGPLQADVQILYVA